MTTRGFSKEDMERRGIEQLDFVYYRLTDLGYEMSDEEKALRDGTHELFREGDAAPQEEKEAAQDE